MFKPKDIVIVVSNPLDEQQGHFLYGEHTIKEVKDVSHLKDTSGQWVLLEGVETDWIDSSYFKLKGGDWNRQVA